MHQFKTLCLLVGVSPFPSEITHGILLFLNCTRTNQSCRLFLFVLSLEQILISDPPVVDDTHAGVEVGRKAQPGEVGDVEPAGGLVEGEEEAGEVDVDAEQRGNVGEGEDGLADAEEQGHPHEVQAELHRVQGRGVLGGAHARHARRQRVQARRHGAVGRVAHQPVQQGPYRAKDLGRWAQRGLLHEAVGILGLLGYCEKEKERTKSVFYSLVSLLVRRQGWGVCNWRAQCPFFYSRLVLKPTPVPSAMGSSTEAAAFSNTSRGMVR